MKYEIKKGQKILLVLGFFLLVSVVSALWFFSWSGSSTANVIGEDISMIEVVDLADFGLVDFSTGNLTRIKEFQVESPNGITETFFNVNWLVTKTELNPDECVYTEGEIEFELWKTDGYGYIGEIENGQLISTMFSEATPIPNLYELRMIALSPNVCPVDYLVEITFAE